MTNLPSDMTDDPTSDFADVLRQELLPIFRETRDEARSRGARARLISRGILAVGGAVALGLAILHPFEDEGARWVVPVFVLAAAGILSAVVRHQTRSNFNRRIKDRVVPILARQLGITDFRARPDPAYLALHALHDLRILPFFTEIDIEDGMSGRWREVGYRLAEVRLRRRRPGDRKDQGDKYELVFKGLAMEVETPVDMPWTLFEVSPAGFLGRVQDATLSARGLQPVHYGDGSGQADAPFRVYSEDPAAARAQLPAIFLQTLARIAAQQGQEPRRIEAGFRGRTFYLCLRRKEEFLEVDAFDTTEDQFTANCRDALEDMALPRRIIDLLIDGPDAG